MKTRKAAQLNHLYVVISITFTPLNSLPQYCKAINKK